jgi:hypothetical protein
MPFLELFDETLDINSTENYDLSIQVSRDGFSFCLLDTIRNKYVLIRSFEPEENKYYNAEKIEEIITQDDFLIRKYKNVSLIMPSQKFTIIPSPLYDPGKRDALFTFNHVKDDDTIIATNKLNDPDSYLVFAVSESILELFNNIYPGIHPVHHVKSLFEHISHSRKSVNTNIIHVHVERDFFNLIVFKNNLLSFCNTFSYRNISDIMYYVLNVFRKLDLRQEETIYLSGMTEKFDDLSSKLSIYIRNVKFAVPKGNFTFSYVFDDVELHRFLNLFIIIK